MTTRLQRPILPYMDFSGGLNIETSNEKLQDNEMTILQNVDIYSRGSVRRRTGRTKIGTIPGTGQGLFFFYRGNDEPDLIAAVSGKLYVKPYGTNTFTEIVIKNLDNTTFTFQTTLPIEAVQYRKVLFVATGTKLVEVTWDEATNSHKASVMSPYKPTVLEVINIGTNAIAENPDTWIQEKEDSVVSIEGITTSIPQGAVNSAVTFTAHVKKPSNINVNYSFSWRKTGSGVFSYGKTNSTDNFCDFSFNEVGGYDIQVETKKVIYPVQDAESLWTATQTGVYQQLSTAMHDTVDDDVNKHCLVLTGSVSDASQDVVWIDLTSPLDMTKANTISWWWTSYVGINMSSNTIQLRFYTQGNLTSPILTVGNAGGEQGRGQYTNDQVPVSWNNTVNSYDNTLTGLDKVVRIALYGARPSGGYIPATQFGTLDKNDGSFRLDNLTMYEAGTEVSYTLTNFQVVGVADPTVDPETYSAIHTSRLIRLHWDRIVLGKDSKYPGQLYFSDLNNPRYYPTNKRIDFSLDRQEPITSVVRFQDFLVVFTKTTISTLMGTHPQDGDVTDGREYRLSLINDTLGCIADKSAKVVKNTIVFLAADGLHSLTPNPYTLQNLEPEKIDFPVKSEMIQDENACAVVHNDQYYLCFPSQKKILRLYYNMNAWVKDVSSKLNLVTIAYYNGTVYNLTLDGNVYLQDETTYKDDDDIYEMIVQTKYCDLQAIFNYKKLRRLFLLARYYEDHTVNLFVRVWADAQIVLDPTIGEAVVGDDGVVKWVSTTEPNMHLYNSTEFGTWVIGQGMMGSPSIFINEALVRGKCRRVRVSFTHADDCACEILGYGYEFKYKAPGRMVST